MALGPESHLDSKSRLTLSRPLYCRPFTVPRNDWRGCKRQGPRSFRQRPNIIQSLQLHQNTSHWSLTSVPRCLNKSQAAAMAGLMQNPESLRNSAKGYADFRSSLNRKYIELPSPTGGIQIHIQLPAHQLWIFSNISTKESICQNGWLNDRW